MTIQTMDKVHAACTVIVRGTEEPLDFKQSPAGCTFQRIHNEGSSDQFVGTYLITLDYPLDTLSCAYALSPYIDPELTPDADPYDLPVSSVLLHVDDRTKVLVVLSDFLTEGGLLPVDWPFHWACWNTQANRGHMFEMESVSPPAV